MRELKYALLGLMMREELTGYDITKKFNGALSRFWVAQHSQIYPELKRLVDEGLVEYRIIIQGEKMEKKLYTITQSGREDIMQWLNTVEPVTPVYKDPFRLRIYFGDNLKPEEMTKLINGQYKNMMESMHQMRERHAQYEETPEMNTEDFSEYLLIKGGEMRHAAYLDWLEWCAEVLNLEIDPELLSQR